MLWFNIIVNYVNIAILGYIAQRKGRGEGKVERGEGREEWRKRRWVREERRGRENAKKINHISMTLSFPSLVVLLVITLMIINGNNHKMK